MLAQPVPATGPEGSSRIFTTDTVSNTPAVVELPQLVAPTLDQLNASLSISTSGNVVANVAMAPLSFWDHEYVPFVSDLRIQLNGSSGTTGIWGVAVSSGATNILGKLQKRYALSDLSNDEQADVAECSTDTPDVETGFVMVSTRDDLMRILRELRGAPVSNEDLQHVDDLVKSIYRLTGTPLVRWSNPLDQCALDLQVLVKSVAERLPNLAESAAEWQAVLAHDVAAVEGTANKNAKAAGDCSVAIFNRHRLRAAFDHAMSLKFSVEADFYPTLKGGAIKDDQVSTAMGSPTFPAQVSFGAFFVGFANWRSRAQLGAAYTYHRSTTDAITGESLGGSVDLAGIIHIFDKKAPGKDGFIPSIGVGVFGRVDACVAGSCLRNNVPVYSSVTYDFVVSTGAYIDLRVSSSLQVQVSLPVNTYLQSSTGGLVPPDIVQLVPTLSVSSASWSL